jgi:hypothetical protein
MSLQQFPSDDSLRTQRMTADEAKSVIDLWQQERVEHTGLTDRPTVPDVAEGLDIGVEDVQRLLAEVRAQRVEEERALALEQELSEIRVAEEDRKLSEIRRQRAELRREQRNSELYTLAPNIHPAKSKPQKGSRHWSPNISFWTATVKEEKQRRTSDLSGRVLWIFSCLLC